MCKMKGILIVLVALGLVLGAVVPAAAGSQVPVRIQFQRGATSGVVTGSLASYGAAQYVFRASAGQTAEIGLWSPDPIGMEIYGADGTLLKPYRDGTNPWRRKLPRTQDYYVTLQAAGADVGYYSLRVTVYARIQFAKGATSATLSSPVQYGVPQDYDLVGGYVLRALAGQRMRVNLSSPHGTVLLGIVGADGVPLKRYEVGDSTWDGILPTTQDYFLRAFGAGGPDSRFTLSVWISPLGQAAPTRIRFAPGTTSAVVGGSLAPGGSARYVLWAARGQRMGIAVVPSAAVQILVAGPGGSRWTCPEWGCWIDPLPASGDYDVTLSLRPGWGTTGYSMTVAIPAE